MKSLEEEKADFMECLIGLTIAVIIGAIIGSIEWVVGKDTALTLGAIFGVGFLIFLGIAAIASILNKNKTKKKKNENPVVKWKKCPVCGHKLVVVTKKCPYCNHKF